MVLNNLDSILIIEDDEDIRNNVRILLESEGYNVEEAGNGRDGLQKISPSVNLIILDIMMPGMSGFDICKEIRKKYVMPILILTAKSDDADKFLGLHLGADDYLTKPFSYVELSARIKALLRRHQVYNRCLIAAETDDEWLIQNDIHLNLHSRYVLIKEKRIQLTETEFQILLLFMKHPKQIFPISTIYENVWDEPFLNSSSGTVMVHIRNLRIKIEEVAEKPKLIQTVWGKGYRFG